MPDKRTYQKTHPWIKFAFHLETIPHNVWVMLGEIASKCDHLSNVPIVPSLAQKLNAVYLSKGALASAAIEGNTLSEEQALEVIEKKASLPPSTEYLQRELENLVATFESCMDKFAHKNELNLTPPLMDEINFSILEGLELDEGIVPGKLRRHEIGVGTYRGAPAEDLPHLITAYCDFLNGFQPPSEFSLVYSIIKAIIAHLLFEWIHPYGDGNGRTGRMIEWLILIQGGVPQPASYLLANHYNATRNNYYRKLNSARGRDQGMAEFVAYAVQGFLDGLRKQVEEVLAHQLSMAWTNYVHEKFQNKKGEAQRRRRKLLLSLPPEEVAIGKLNHLSPELAEAYAGKTGKALVRDLNELADMGLLVKTRRGYVKSNWSKMLGFLVWRNPHTWQE